MTLGSKRSTLWADNPTHILLPDAQYRQNAELVEGVPSKIQNRRHLLCIAGMLDDRPWPPDSALITSVVVTELELDLVAEGDGCIYMAWPRGPHERHLGCCGTRCL